MPAVFAEDIALAMEMRTAGADELTVFRQTGVRPMDITVAEIMGMEAYPLRGDEPAAPAAGQGAAHV
ncbi:MAG: hypothetical protein M0Q49_02400 [Porticoccaceae bacterium]|nr:hypothetical protein [Porticoccaceae bacterium]